MRATGGQTSEIWPVRFAARRVENSETRSSLSFAKDCGYITAEQVEELHTLSRNVGKMLGRMISNSRPFLISDTA